MKIVMAVIKPFRLDDVRAALCVAGAPGMTVTEVKGFGHHTGHDGLYRGAGQVVDFLPRVRVEVAIEDWQLDEVVEAILAATNRGRAGDGKIFVFDIEQVIRVRTRESGAAAL